MERLGDVWQLKQLAAAQHDEIARLTGLIPVGVKADPFLWRNAWTRLGRERRHGQVETYGNWYEPYQVQDLVLSPRAAFERWLTLEGKTILAPCPAACAAISVRNCVAWC